jgi:hypothetical protein
MAWLAPNPYIDGHAVFPALAPSPYDVAPPTDLAPSPY